MSEMNSLLKKIIENNKDTDCGKSFDFEHINSLEDFEKNVPLTDYYYYYPLVELTTRIGEKDIFVNGPIVGYTLSASAMGKNKEIPCTKEHILEYEKLFDDIDVKGTTFLMMESMPKTVTFADGTYLDSIWGIAMHEAEKKFSDKGFFKKKKYTSPVELIVTKEVIDSLHIRLLFALADEKVEQIVAPYMWGVWEICNYLDTSSQLLISDLEKGEISSSITISDELRSVLNKKLKVDEARIAELKAIFKNKERIGLLKKIWPELTRIVALYSGGYEIYRKNILPYVGMVEICNGPLISPEGIIGKAIPGTDYHELFNKNVYIELKELDSDDVVRVCDALCGKMYEVIITNSSGLYRFKSRDVITIISNEDGKCVFEYAYRISTVSSIDEISVNSRQIQEVVMNLEKETGINITDYCYYTDEDNNCFEIFIEGSNEDVAKMNSLDCEACSDLADKCLGKLNPDFAKALEENRIASCKVKLLQPQTQMLFRDMVKYKKRTAPDYIRPIRRIKTIEQDRFFNQQIM